MSGLEDKKKFHQWSLKIMQEWLTKLSKYFIKEANFYFVSIDMFWGFFLLISRLFCYSSNTRYVYYLILLARRNFYFYLHHEVSKVYIVIGKLHTARRNKRVVHETIMPIWLAPEQKSLSLYLRFEHQKTIQDNVSKFNIILQNKFHGN